MAPNKKKRKNAVNPLRVYATTSIASSKKQPDQQDSLDVSETASTATAPASEDGISASHENDDKEHVRDFNDLTPDEFAKQLEDSALQLLLEKLGRKVQKDSARQIARARTDCRLLRGQAERLHVRSWLQDDLILETLELVKLETRNDGGPPDLLTANNLSEEDFIARVWTLKETLIGLEFTTEQVDEAVEYIIANPPATEGAQLWGFEECLEFLALQDKGLGEYDRPNTLSSRANTESIDNGSSMVDSPVPMLQSEPGDPSASNGAQESPAALDRLDSRENVTAKSHEKPHIVNDAVLSDVESDLEEEGMILKYLSIKARLYELNPTLADSGPLSRKHKAKSNADDSTLTGLTPDIQKLQQRLQALQSDILFDKRDADVRWVHKRNEIVKEKAARRKLDLFEPEMSESNGESAETQAAMLEAETDRDGGWKPDDDEGLRALFDEQVIQPTEDGQPAVKIRDFGKSTGISPRRVLEETCRARDSGVKLIYKPVSNVSFASRYSVTITWSKEQDPLLFHLSTIPTKTTQRSHVFTMISVATPTTTQSEAYISTAALFMLFSSSPKEEKCYLRLPPVWRDLWNEFAEIKKEHDETANREILRHIRDRIRDHTYNLEEIPGTLTSEFQKRLKMDDNVAEHGQSIDPDLSPADYIELQTLWSRKTSSSAYKRMLQARRNLPMFQAKEATLSAIEENQVTIICGKTGCGKSTQVPSFILERELSNGRACKIYVTEPRRISAISLAHRVSEELGEHKNDLGTPRSLIGYAIRLESHVSPQTRLVFATTGIVLRMLETSGDIEGITHLIIDEVHERSIDTDFLLIVIRTLMVHRPNLKVVLMSATVDAKKFSEYLGGAPILTVPGRTFPVQTKFLEDAIELTHYSSHNDKGDPDNAEADSEENPEGTRTSGLPLKLEGYSASTRNTLAHYDEYKVDYSLIMKVIDKISKDKGYESYSRAILVFLPGIAEIRRLNDILSGHPFFSHNWLIYPLHSTIATDEQQAAFQIPPPGYRKIVLATNIAETGITIPDVTCVIDTGKHKEMRFDERRQLSRLTQSFISRANAKQRRGRAGRVQEGLCFHLFTRMRHDELMAEHQTPEMLRLSLQDLVIRVKKIRHLGNIEKTLQSALNPPSAKNIRRAIDALIEVKALTPNEELTALGEQIAKLPLDAYLGKLILMGSIFGCLDVALTIAAMLSSKSPFITPLGNRQAADTARLAYKKGESDLLTAYNAYCAWRRVSATPGSSEDQFCRKNFLSAQNLANIEELKGQLLSNLAEAGFVNLGEEERSALSRTRYSSRQRHFVLVPASSNSNNDYESMVTSIIGLSFYPKLLIRDGKGWRNVSNNQPVSLSPTSVNKINPTAKYLSYYHIMQSNSRFTNAHETSPVPIPALALLIGSATFNLYAGVMIIDGNRFRFSVADWKTLLAIKALRTRIAEIVAKALKSPGKALTGRAKRWLEIWGEVVRCASEAAEKEGKRTR